MDELSKVFILIDQAGRVLRCEGGYTMSNINGEGWVFIDEGNGDRFNLCQSHYFDALYNENGVCRYVYENGVVRLCTVEEITAQEEALIKPEESGQSEEPVLDIYDELEAAYNEGVNSI